MEFRTLDPTTGRLVERFPTLDDAGLERALDRAAAAFDRIRAEPPATRREPLERAAALLEARAAELARTMALEMGKPVAEGEAEARKCAWGCRHYAEHAEGMLAPRPSESDGSEAFVRPEPLGPVLAIMPWNFPLWQVFRFAAPALAAGNVVLLKHAPSVPRCAIAIEALLAEAGLEDGAFQSLFLTDDQAARAIGDARVRGVTLTGSTRAGRTVAALAGRAIKPVVLELGGSDPFLVLDDADLDRAAEAAVVARCQNAGQSCIAAKRFLVQHAVYDRFRERFVAGMAARVVGDPAERATQVGPLAREDLRATLAAQVDATVAAGARALTGGRAADGPGFFYPPTVLESVPAESPGAREELFGPVAALFRVADDDEAVGLANATAYGLGASLWTRDPGRARRLAARLQAGSVFVNGIVKSDPRLPFGGMKDSGHGRELGREGLLAFTNLKTVWVA